MTHIIGEGYGSVVDLVPGKKHGFGYLQINKATATKELIDRLNDGNHGARIHFYLINFRTVRLGDTVRFSAQEMDDGALTAIPHQPEASHLNPAPRR